MRVSPQPSPLNGARVTAVCFSQSHEPARTPTRGCTRCRCLGPNGVEGLVERFAVAHGLAYGDKGDGFDYESEGDDPAYEAYIEGGI